MNLFLIAYANAAVVVPALWVGARLWMRPHSRRSVPCLVSAQIIAFPAVKQGPKPKARARDPIEGRLGRRLTRDDRRRLQKADHYVAERRRSLVKED